MSTVTSGAVKHSIYALFSRPTETCENHGNNGCAILLLHTLYCKSNRILQELFQEAEALLEKWKHPDPYKPPTAPGGLCYNPINHTCDLDVLKIGAGSKYERNIPAPILDRKLPYPLYDLAS